MKNLALGLILPGLFGVVIAGLLTTPSFILIILLVMIMAAFWITDKLYRD